MIPSLTVYTREGCHLCEDMLQQLAQYKVEQDFTLNVIEINDRPDLEALYGTRVPVLLHGDREICHYFLDEVALKQCFGVS